MMEGGRRSEEDEGGVRNDGGRRSEEDEGRREEVE